MSKKTKYPQKDAEWLHHFDKEFGYKLIADPFQLDYVRNMIASPSDVQAVIVDAAAGTGKTSLAVKTAHYLIEKGEYDELIYYRAPLSMHDQGFLGGTLEEKERPYMMPCVQALDEIQFELAARMQRDGQLSLTTTTFERGMNRVGHKFVIVDEAQNFTLNELRAVLTRFGDDAKIVIIGSTLQNDAPKKTNYGKFGLQPFTIFIRHLVDEESDVSCKFCPLVNNYRGKFSQWADKVDETIKKIEKEIKENVQHGRVS
ncbi:MAG: PhoH family protein [Enterococcus sp.]